MPYTIGFVRKDRREVCAAKATTAHQALTFIEAVQNNGDEVHFIRSPQEGDIGIEMLRVLFKEEAEEVPNPL